MKLSLTILKGHLKNDDRPTHYILGTQQMTSVIFVLNIRKYCIDIFLQNLYQFHTLDIISPENT